jgi:WD40 repeat protein
VEAVRLVEPVVEEVKVNKQLLADANKLMTDARIKGMKAVASLAGHANYVRSVAFSPDGQHIVSGSLDNLVKVWSVSARKEVASLAGLLFGRSPSVPMGNLSFLEVLTTW